MSRVLAMAAGAFGSPLKARLYLRMGGLLVTSIVVCATLVHYFGNQFLDLLAGVASVADVVVASILPYLCAAAVAGITVVALSAMLPSVQSVEPLEVIIYRLRQLRAGDLSFREKIPSTGPMRTIAMELSQAIGMLRHELTAMKIINRQQWVALCNIREAVEARDCDMALVYIEQMEKMWDKTAEIEGKLRT